MTGRRSTVSYVASVPASRAELFAAVRTRRVIALAIDLPLIALLSALIWLGLLILTFGVSLILAPPLLPLVAFFYNGLSVSGANMATPGMRAMDLEMRMRESGARAPFINAAAQALFFYLSWFFPLVFVVSLIDSEKRCLHDILAGVIVTRRL
jgi:uncharacterized RDD family membrane protein YckC